MTVDYVRVYQAPDTAERFETTFVDTTVGWRKVTLPFSNFKRSAVQPVNAPNDGLTLTAARLSLRSGRQPGSHQRPDRTPRRVLSGRGARGGPRESVPTDHSTLKLR